MSADRSALGSGLSAGASGLDEPGFVGKNDRLEPVADGDLVEDPS